MTYPHFVIPNKPMKLNEKLGYCSICWNVEAKRDNFGARQESKYSKPYSDSNINPNSGPCGNDTL